MAPEVWQQYLFEDKILIQSVHYKELDGNVDKLSLPGVAFSLQQIHLEEVVFNRKSGFSVEIDTIAVEAVVYFLKFGSSSFCYQGN